MENMTSSTLLDQALSAYFAYRDRMWELVEAARIANGIPEEVSDETNLLRQRARRLVEQEMFHLKLGIDDDDEEKTYVELRDKMADQWLRQDPELLKTLDFWLDPVRTGAA
jgi:hypothetical protein